MLSQMNCKQAKSNELQASNKPSQMNYKLTSYWLANVFMKINGLVRIKEDELIEGTTHSHKTLTTDYAIPSMKKTRHYFSLLLTLYPLLTCK